MEYLIDVRPFLDDVGGGIHVADTIELDSLLVGAETFASDGPVSFDVNVSNAGEALIAIGRVSYPVKATCSRCLCEFEAVIEGDVEGYWPRPGHHADEDDITGEIGMDGTIDLGPALTAALVIEAPFAPLHSEDCAGLCATCGADLNEGPCSCEQDVDVEHPFAALKTLVEDNEE